MTIYRPILITRFATESRRAKATGARHRFGNSGRETSRGGPPNVLLNIKTRDEPAALKI